MVISDTQQEYFLSWTNRLVGTDAISKKEPHGDEGVVYQILTPDKKYFLKLKSNSDFSDERDRLEWLKDKLPVPRVISSTHNDGVGALLLSSIEGKNLAALSKEWPAEKIVDELVRVLHLFHATDPTDWPFEKLELGMVLVHGDACLPNFIFSKDGFGGYIDLGETALSYPETDLRAAVWSLHHNLGPGHGVEFLTKYGYSDATDEVAEQMRLEYENYKRFWMEANLK